LKNHFKLKRIPKDTKANTQKITRMHVLSGVQDLYFIHIQLHLMGADSPTWSKRALSLPPLQTAQTHSLTIRCRLILIPIHLYARICKSEEGLYCVGQRMRSVLRSQTVRGTQRGFFGKRTQRNKLPMSTNHCLINQTEFVLLFELHCIANTILLYIK